MGINDKPMPRWCQTGCLAPSYRPAHPASLVTSTQLRLSCRGQGAFASYEAVRAARRRAHQDKGAAVAARTACPNASRATSRRSAFSTFVQAPSSCSVAAATSVERTSGAAAVATRASGSRAAAAFCLLARRSRLSSSAACPMPTSPLAGQLGVERTDVPGGDIADTAAAVARPDRPHRPGSGKGPAVAHQPVQQQVEAAHRPQLPVRIHTPVHRRTGVGLASAALGQRDRHRALLQKPVLSGQFLERFRIAPAQPGRVDEKRGKVRVGFVGGSGQRLSMVLGSTWRSLGPELSMRSSNASSAGEQHPACGCVSPSASGEVVLFACASLLGPRA